MRFQGEISRLNYALDILELMRLRFCQKPFKPGVLLLQLGEPFGLFCLHAAVELTPAVVGWLKDLQHSAGVCDGLVLDKQLVSRFELADDLLGCVKGAFHGGVPGPVWPDEDSHSP
jgi:hypothetical protein